jgi:hypothetical protein
MTGQGRIRFGIRERGLTMKGSIHRYFDDIKMGTIQGENGIKYSFTEADWLSGETEPREGMQVVFDLGPRRAMNVKVKKP